MGEGGEREGRCPRCGRVYRYALAAEHPPFPFCSARCRDVDLGNWLTGKYAIPGAPAPAEAERPEATARPRRRRELEEGEALSEEAT